MELVRIKVLRVLVRLHRQQKGISILDTPNLSACIRGMMSKQLMIDGISLGDVASLKDLDIKMDAFCKDVWSAVNSRISESKKGVV